MITFAQPVWFVLAIPLGILWHLWPMPTRLLKFLRAMGFISLLLAMCQPAIKLPDRAGTIVVVADRSDSMPDGSTGRQKEAIDLMQKSMGSRDHLAVVAFGQRAVVERPPQAGAFGGFAAEVGSDASSLAEALETAIALIPPETPGRIMVISDGKWTGRDPITPAAKAAGRGIAIDHRVLSRPQLQDLAIQVFHTPDSVLPGQAFVMTAWVLSPEAQKIRYQLKNGGRTISAGEREIPAGLSRLLFRDQALQPGTAQYRLQVDGAENDSVPENNTARALVGIRGAKPILALSSSGEKSGLIKLLRSGRVELIGANPSEVRWSLEQLSQFSAVLIENVMAASIGTPGMETIASWVEQSGSGMMLTGGKKSYAPGGYFGSPLERVIPVSMEMRREHRKMRLAIVVALDRSGSMAAPVGAGKTKMDLANLGTAQVLDLLGPGDELGVIAVDSSPHIIVELDTVERNLGMRNEILSIDSMGGGIFVYEALVAASQMVLKASAETKHIILFSDAADSEEPGNYKELLGKCREAGISVSVIGLGRDTDTDAALLEDVAKLGEGNIYFTAEPTELPRIFAQDTFTVARSTFIEESTRLKTTGGLSTIGGQAGWNPPPAGGYNLTYLRPEANLAILTEDEYAAPFVATWQAGSGRVLAFTGEADGEFAGDFAKWERAGDLYATMARWTAGEQPELPDNMLITQEVRDGVAYIQLHLDPERAKEFFATPPVVKVLHGLPGRAPGKFTQPLRWQSADLLEATIPIRGQETVLATVDIPGINPQTLPPVCLPYSPEFAPEQANRGRQSLEKISTASGGVERLELASLWDALEPIPQFVDLAVWLIILGLIAFLLEIFQRRTGLLQFARRRRVGLVEEAAEPARVVSKFQPAINLWRRKSAARKTATAAEKEKTPGKSIIPSTASVEPDSNKAADSNQKSGDSFGAMREAMSRAKKRRGGGKE